MICMIVLYTSFLNLKLIFCSWFISRWNQILLLKFSFCKAIFDVHFSTLTVFIFFVILYQIYLKKKEAHLGLCQKFVTTPLQKQLKAVNYFRKRFYSDVWKSINIPQQSSWFREVRSFLFMQDVSK